MRRLLVILLVLTACGPSENGSLGPAPTGLPPASAEPRQSASSTPSPDVEPSSTIAIQVWFVREGRVMPARRTKPKTVATSRLALTELVAGPSTVEAAAGVGSAVPGDTTFDLVGITNGVATVNFPAAFYTGGSQIARLRQAQVVYTLTQFATVSRVGFQSAGAAAGWPLGRDDYNDLLPPIIAMSPFLGQRVSSPLTVAGTAIARESTVNIRILDATGKEIATKFATATCGNGCRGEYTTTVAFQQCGSEQNGTVEVYEISGEDGSRVHTFGVPVILAACPQ